MTSNMETELDAATRRVNKLLNTSVDWEVDDFGAVGLNVTVWTSPEGDVVNRLADKLRRAADAMEVSR